MTPSNPFPIYIFEDLAESLKTLAEAEGTTLTDYARNKLYDLTKSVPKEFEPLFRNFCERAKQFAATLSELPSVPAEQRQEVKNHLTMVLLEAIITRNPDLLTGVGLVERLH